jgi:hypothetical protein
MNNLSAKDFGFSHPAPSGADPLESYIKSLPEEVIARLSQPDDELTRLMNQYLIEILGQLPHSRFDVMVTTDRNTLAHLLASAMAYGYFLKGAQQRMNFEQTHRLTAEERSPE